MAGVRVLTWWRRFLRGRRDEAPAVEHTASDTRPASDVQSPPHVPVRGEVPAAGDAAAVVAVSEALLTRLNDPEARSRREAIASIAALDLCALDTAQRHRVAGAMRPLLGDAVPEIQLEAAVTLAVALDDSRARSLLLELAHAGTAAAEGVLSGATADVAKSIRLTAVRTLGRLGDAATRAVLLAILRDADGEVRAAACTALGASRDPRAVHVLRRIEESDADAAVRTEARAAREAIAQRSAGR